MLPSVCAGVVFLSRVGDTGLQDFSQPITLRLKDSGQAVRLAVTYDTDTDGGLTVAVLERYLSDYMHKSAIHILYVYK